tara:strand:+ start:78202 stop:78963 length:762 start_codon:yes stop_codon:yes gene_type:complete
MRFKILGSSSSGNAALLCTDECKVLIDAGFSARKLKQLLEREGESLDSIDAVFLTHEHSDHTTGLTGLSKYEHLTFFANEDTASVLQERLKRPMNWKLFETGSTFAFRDLNIHSFSIPHDAHDPVGYIFEGTGTSKRRVAWVTDLGYIPQYIHAKIRDVEILVIECNYDNELLENDERRPWSVKQRIRGRHGHLPNEAVWEFISQMENPAWEEVYLAHLSAHCNRVELVESLFAPLREKDIKFTIKVVDPALV